MPVLDRIYFTSPEIIKTDTSVSSIIDEKWINEALINSVSNVRQLIGTPLLDAMRTALRSAKTISAATQANPVEVTTPVAHGLSSGDTGGILYSRGMPDLDGYYEIVVNGANTFTLIEGSTPVDGTSFSAYTGGARFVSLSAIRFEMLRKLVRLQTAHAVHHLIIPLTLKIANAGVVQISEFGQGNLNVRAVDPKVLATVRDNYKTQAITIEKEITDYYCEYDEEFPEWCDDTALKESRGRTSSNVAFW